MGTLAVLAVLAAICVIVGIIADLVRDLGAMRAAERIEPEAIAGYSANEVRKVAQAAMLVADPELNIELVERMTEDLMEDVERGFVPTPAGTYEQLEP